MPKLPVPVPPADDIEPADGLLFVIPARPRRPGRAESGLRGVAANWLATGGTVDEPTELRAA